MKRSECLVNWRKSVSGTPILQMAEMRRCPKPVYMVKVLGHSFGIGFSVVSFLPDVLSLST